MGNVDLDVRGIFAIIVTYNAVGGGLHRLITELTGQVEGIIVVDNGSANAAELSVLYGNVAYIHLLVLEQNMGIAFAQNMGMDFSKKSGAEYLIFFDQDSVIGKRFVLPLKDAFLSLSTAHKVGLVAPVFKDERKGFFYPLISLNKYGVRRKIILADKEDNPVPISFAISSGTFTSMAVVADVGDMRSDFFIDYVDIEWCLRAVHAGYSLFAIPGVCMLHSIGDRSIPFLKWRLAIHSEWRRYYRIRNGFFLLRLAHVPKILALREVVVNTLHQAILILTQKNKLLQLRHFFRGVRDAFSAFDRT
jgi:rhamnosyltransferase